MKYSLFNKELKEQRQKIHKLDHLMVQMQTDLRENVQKVRGKV